jgi:hypothetical protein
MKSPIVACVGWHRAVFPEALRKDVASRRFHTDSIGHPLQGATWQLVVNPALITCRFHLATC